MVVSEDAAEERTLDAIMLGVTVLLAETTAVRDSVMLLLLLLVVSAVADCAKAIEATPKRSGISDCRMIGWCLVFFCFVYSEEQQCSALRVQPFNILEPVAGSNINKKKEENEKTKYAMQNAMRRPGVT
jgi:hypothetical protein